MILKSFGIWSPDPVEPAKYKIRIEAKGYESWINENVDVWDDISTTIGPIVLKKKGR